MIKQVVFRGVDEQGNVLCQPLFISKDGIEKTASLDMKSKLHPKVQDFIGTLRPTPAGIYVLVNAMGAGEYWGSNINGDLFPEKALIHAPENWNDLSPEQMREVAKTWPYGYPTFMNAYPYKHHVNKDPSRAFGRVELAVWNPEMHRVELIVYLDRVLCKQFDAYDIIERIENGEFPDVSMGCKVPCDFCTICEHASKTPNDYCEHAKLMMNKILPDGRKVAVRNEAPRFFDISFVFIGADKTAKVMVKLAQITRPSFIDLCLTKTSAELGSMFSNVERLDAPYDLVTEHWMDKAASVASPEEIFEDGLQDHPYAPPKQEESKEPAPILGGGGWDTFDAEFLEKEANDPIQKRMVVQGLKIAIEWPKGSLRQYRDKKTNKVNYQQKMKADYGYISGTKDADGEELDVYVGPNHSSNRVWVIKQLKPNGDFDEHKVMLGYSSEKEAVSSYKAHMPENRFGGAEGMDVATFKKTNLKDAQELAKEASDLLVPGDLTKVALAIFGLSLQKSASHKKLGEIIKSVPAGPFTKETLPKVEKSEDDIPSDVLDLMGGLNIGNAVSTPGMMGIVLKPHEFQRVMLIRIGEKPLADQLDQKHMSFSPTTDIDNSIKVDPSLSDDLLKELLILNGSFRRRSAATPSLELRKNAPIKNSAPEAPPSELSGLMKKVAAAYNGYRLNLVKKANAIASNLSNDPQLRAGLFGSSMVEAFACGVNKTASASVLGPESLAYLVGAYQADRDLLASHPEVRSILDDMGGYREQSV